MAVGIRIECDVTSCGRHFEVAGHEMGAHASVLCAKDRVAVHLSAPVIECPRGWAVGEELVGQLRVLCALHAEIAS